MHFKILSPLYLSSVYCIIFQNIVPLYLSSVCIVHSKLHNIYCQLRSIELFKASRFPRIQEENRVFQQDRHSLRRQTKSCGGLGGGSGSSSLSLSLSHLSLPFWKSFVHQAFLSKYFLGTIWPYISKKKEIAITCLAVVTFLL